MKNGMAGGTDDLCQVVRVSATDDRQLYPLIVLLQEMRHIGAVGDRIDVYVGVALLPIINLAFEFRVWRPCGVPVAEEKHRGVPQRGLLHGLVYDVVVARSLLGRDHYPIDALVMLTALWTNDRDRAVRRLRQLACR